jgi:hypothetical protein
VIIGLAVKFPGNIQRLKNWKSIESITYWVIWLILFVFPFIFWDFGDDNQRWRIIVGWFRVLPFLLIFILHNYCLLPLFLLKKKFLIYFAGSLFIILIINYVFVYSSVLHDFIFRLVEGQWPNRPDFPNTDPGILPGHAQEGGQGIGHGPGHHKGMGYWRKHNPEYLIFTYNVFLSILIVGVNVIMRFSTQWLTDEQKRKEIEKEHIHSQLTALQHQVSPHFFMNTLNNIHALIDYSKEDAKDAILRLSDMMRYLLYDSDRGKTTLSKEIDFLNSYIDLMRLRIDDSVELNIRFPKPIPELDLHPFLFIPFVENAFKYGIVPNGKTLISVSLEVGGNTIHFSVKNSKSLKKPDDNKYSGIGIENARKRLELLYGEKYTLSVVEREKEFEIDLVIPYDDKLHSH